MDEDFADTKLDIFNTITLVHYNYQYIFLELTLTSLYIVSKSHALFYTDPCIDRHTTDCMTFI